jgi:hypothetical protein
MAILLGTLLPGSIPIGYGQSAPRRGFARTHSGADLPIVVKQVPFIQVAAELFCARLGMLLGLPIPGPIIVLDPVQNVLLAGSVDAGYPNLLQHFAVDPAHPEERLIAAIAKRLSQWTKVHAVVSFDEWIKNIDRNLQNILWDGHDKFVLIDHGQSLGLAIGDSNKLLDMVLAVSDANDKETVRRAVLDVARQFTNVPALRAAKEVSESPVSVVVDAAAFVDFLSQRLPQLNGLLNRRFPPSPQPELDLEDEDVRDG